MDSPPVGLGDGTGDAEPQADTPHVFGSGFGNPVKAAEDLLQFILRKTDSRVGDHQGGPIVIRLK
jgi:hypothetical protein